ncbi:MAG: H-type small acid-soluble spore protein [Syntrophomonadaceae bacterium]|nr:H-type small acid-soluble spore protein [Syntrophomonadaceae bacterium]MDD3889994.1 H-type small acid-soluble spore protein [Syntrophomonadaceae bacterium]MDD4550283.1 H-type small acid-soluble spore protein [Syntrophomonadaceae bacterium]
MDINRAKEIVESLGVIEVLYQGAPVWIEGLEGDSAKVRYLDSYDHMSVSVGELVENK